MSLIGYYKDTMVYDHRAIATVMGEEFADYVEKAYVDPGKRFAFATVGHHIESVNHHHVISGVEQLINRLFIHQSVTHEEVVSSLDYVRKALGDHFIVMCHEHAWYADDGKFFKVSKFPIAVGTGCYHFIAGCLLGEEPLKAASLAGKMSTQTSSVCMQVKHEHLKPFLGEKKRVARKRVVAKKPVAKKATPRATNKGVAK